MCVSIYNIQEFIYTCLLSYLYMYCRVTKKRFPMLCHIVSIQVCRSTCFMKCKHTIKKVQVLQFYSEYTGGLGVGGVGTGRNKKVTLTGRRHRVRRECGTLIKLCCSCAFSSSIVRWQQRCLRQCLCASRFGISC